MLHHTCFSCQRGFTAASYDEAVEEMENLKSQNPEEYGDLEFDEMVKDNTIAYARFCPYCGKDVEQI